MNIFSNFKNLKTFGNWLINLLQSTVNQSKKSSALRNISPCDIFSYVSLSARVLGWAEEAYYCNFSLAFRARNKYNLKEYKP